MVQSFWNIKTTFFGLVLIILGIYGMAATGLDKTLGGAIITAGLGLVVAKDGNVTGGTKEQ